MAVVVAGLPPFLELCVEVDRTRLLQHRDNLLAVGCLGRMHDDHGVPAAHGVTEGQRLLIGGEYAFHGAPEAAIGRLVNAGAVAVDQLDRRPVDARIPKLTFRRLGLLHRVIDGDNLIIVNVRVVQVYIVPSGGEICGGLGHGVLLHDNLRPLVTERHGLVELFFGMALAYVDLFHHE